MSVGKMTGPKKAAILLLALGEDAAADVMKKFGRSRNPAGWLLYEPLYRRFS